MFSRTLRRRRLRPFAKFLEESRGARRILDVGGTQDFWQSVTCVWGGGRSIVLLNTLEEKVSMPGVSFVKGDAKDLSQFKSKEFDVVFSNSMLEHLETYANQRLAASEMRRVGKKYFVQTPNYWFPIEPHFMFPFFHFLSGGIRCFLVKHFALGWYPRIGEEKNAREAIRRIRLLKEHEMRRLFPEAVIRKEKILFLTKSIIAYYG